MEIRPCLVSTYLRRSNRAWSASFSRPRGSQNPRGGWAPISDSKDILRADEDAMRLVGIKAATESKDAIKAMNRNIFCSVESVCRILFNYASPSDPKEMNSWRKDLWFASRSLLFGGFIADFKELDRFIFEHSISPSNCKIEGGILTLTTVPLRTPSVKSNDEALSGRGGVRWHYDW